MTQHCGELRDLYIACGVPEFASTDAIRDYTHLLAYALAPHARAVVHERRRDGTWTVDGSDGAWYRDRTFHRTASEADWVLLQYNPFSYGRFGFAPWLPRELLRLRRTRRRPRIAVMVHESYVPLRSVAFAVMGSWQRAQLFGLVRAADVVFASTSAWLPQLQRMGGSASLVHLPVPSNFPDRSADRQAERDRLGVADGTVVLATLGSDHPSRSLAEIIAATNRVAASGIDVLLLNLGAHAPHIAGLDPRVRVEVPGKLPAAEVAGYLAGADIFLGAFDDGVSTRRGSVMAALQHGLPTVGNCGPNTDSILLDQPGLLLTPLGDTHAFGAVADQLARDAPGRARVGAAARTLYESKFDWSVLAETVVAHLGAATTSDRLRP